MKFMHLSDLHLGKRVNGYSMLEDQKYILIKINRTCSFRIDIDIKCKRIYIEKNR